MNQLAQTAFRRPNLAIVANFVDEAEDRLGVEIVVLVLVELATLNYIDAALTVLFQLFLAVIDPFFDVVETIGSAIEKFRINVCPHERLDEFQLGRPIPDKGYDKFMVDWFTPIHRLP